MANLTLLWYFCRSYLINVLILSLLLFAWVGIKVKPLFKREHCASLKAKCFLIRDAVALDQWTLSPVTVKALFSSAGMWWLRCEMRLFSRLFVPLGPVVDAQGQDESFNVLSHRCPLQQPLPGHPMEQRSHRWRNTQLGPGSASWSQRAGGLRLCRGGCGCLCSPPAAQLPLADIRGAAEVPVSCGGRCRPKRKRRKRRSRLRRPRSRAGPPA
ncbi:uncharacterized protein LOC118562596 isoform X2 [Fundulus heteroclitus]|uniref:uncharacterized protein LOC118562596 isoform X2 n=1 Tax=Fundulus heteroclitus TaxID=8078 RepID=UPI00165C5D04|nr:uncharacterized protein LOC118562596 isoform X2 [Fundulus heteroclitus]